MIQQNAGVRHPMRDVSPGGQRRFAGPLYAQVCDEIRNRITSQDWPPGWAFPNEGDLAREFEVSVGTMRKALGLLEDERLITRRRGRGTFVADPTSADPWQFCFNLSIRGGWTQMQCRLTSMPNGQATSEEASLLLIKESDHVVRLLREHCDNDGIVALEKIVVPAAILPNLAEQVDLSRATLFALYHQHYNILIKRFTEDIFASRIDRLLMQDHGTVENKPLLSKNRIAFDGHDRPIEWSLLQVLQPDAHFVSSQGRVGTEPTIAA